MKSPLSELQHRHAVILSSMQLHFKLAKTLEDMLRMELSCVQQRSKATEDEVQLHSQLAKSLENQLRMELSYVEESFHEMENFSTELLNLQGSYELEKADLQNA